VASDRGFGWGGQRSSPSRPWWGLALLLLVLATLAAGVWRLIAVPEEPRIRATLSAAAALAGGDTAGCARVLGPAEFTFPDDHGPHPEYRTEWWYLTGNLTDRRGRRFGYQLTFFRNSLSPDPAEGSSVWRTNQLWMGHFAVTDVEAGGHIQAERLARGAAGLAGARAAPFRVWLEDWEIRFLGEGSSDAACSREAPVERAAPADGRAGLFPLILQARHGGVALELELTSSKPPVFQGVEGFSPKGPDPGNASRYISFTRLPTRGILRLDDVEYEVEGSSWMDREWSTFALDEAHEGWDWFSLQLEDGRDIMFFELRRSDGRPEPLNHGVLVEADGSYRMLAAEDVGIRITREWTSPLDGTTYPAGWTLTVPGEGLELEIRPLVDDQEMNLSVRYWEGAVEVVGRGPTGPVRGKGFVELTGYGEDGDRSVTGTGRPEVAGREGGWR
jgi:predicted secreted hydrolase